MGIIQFCVRILLMIVFVSSAVFIVSTAQFFVDECTIVSAARCALFPKIITLVKGFFFISLLYTAYCLYFDKDSTKSTFSKFLSMPWSLVVAVVVLFIFYILLGSAAL